MATSPALAKGVGSPARLKEKDFVVIGLQADMTQNDVRKILGDPQRTRMRTYHLETDAELLEWSYPDLVVSFGGGPSIFGVLITGPRYATRRGLRVGDTSDHVLALYGTPEDRYKEGWYYRAPEDDLRVIRVEVRQGKVSSIYVGWLVD